MGKKNKSKTTPKDINEIKICSSCNPKRYLKFNFSFINYESGSFDANDVAKLFEKIRFLSSEPYASMIFKYQGDKMRFIENLPLSQIRKQVPHEFREIFPVETNEKYSVFRVYNAGGPRNSRVIGMIKNTIFYIFFLDWDGKLYDHN